MLPKDVQLVNLNHISGGLIDELVMKTNASPYIHNQTIACPPLRHPEAKPKDLAVGKPGKTAPSGSRNKRFFLGKAPSTQAVAPLRMTIPRHPEA